MRTIDTTSSKVLALVASSVALGVTALWFASAGIAQSRQSTPVAGAGTAADLFEPIRAVLQHPRCQNCHIPGDAPLQYDAGLPHAQFVKRGPDGHGSPGMQCETCHQKANAESALGPNAPPGAPNWHLPPPTMKMVFKDVSAAQLCRTIKDPTQNGNRSMDQFVTHMADDPLVAWGWAPGGDRRPVTPSQTEVVDAVKRWVQAGAPCPG